MQKYTRDFKVKNAHVKSFKFLSKILQFSAESIQRKSENTTTHVTNELGLVTAIVHACGGQCERKSDESNVWGLVFGCEQIPDDVRLPPLNIQLHGDK